MAKNSFKATEGLLNDVMKKQSGVIEKAWLEALMNGVDANADTIAFEIDESSTEYSDDGDSMTQPEIERYFEQFGLKDDDIEDKEFGKFRMGRGQIFNFGVNIWRARENYMVISLDDESVIVDLPECTTEDDESIIDSDGDEYEVDTSGLEYALLDAEQSDSGLSIEVLHYDSIDDIDNTLDQFKKLAKYVSWLHDVDVIVNGEKLDNEPEVIDETKLAYFCEGYTNYKTNSPIYNKGAYVDDFNLGPMSVTIISKKDLDVTLDRTDILDHDPKWSSIKDQYVEVVMTALEDKVDMTTDQRNWMLRQGSKNQNNLWRIADLPLVEDVTGDVHTIQEASGKRVGFAERDDGVAEEAMNRTDALMVNNTQESAFNTLAESANEMLDESDVKEYSEIIENEMQFEMDEIDRSSLSKRRKANLVQIESALRDLGFRLNVKAGYSNHKTVWKDQNDALFIHKDSLNCKQRVLATTVLLETVRAACHQGECMTTFNEDYSLNRNFYEAVMGDKFAADVSYDKVQQRMLSGKYKE
jgi:hypothetical protein